MGETPKFHMDLRKGIYEGWIFTNADNTALSWVIKKTVTNTEPPSVCIVWSGESLEGNVITPIP